jgi:hypothetical protein
VPSRQEIHYNTPEQIEGYLRIALEVLDRVKPPAELREVAFAKAVDLASNKNVVVEQFAAVPDLSGVRH